MGEQIELTGNLVRKPGNSQIKLNNLDNNYENFESVCVWESLLKRTGIEEKIIKKKSF